ncbi:MAG: 4'-phosphopantetheinyl transferase superfamily protein [Lachnospiraceae bacterium]|nr:4'-phosphopantetheinyl transferase superfamily protein [Lachnospiraceae bacterium]
MIQLLYMDTRELDTEEKCQEVADSLSEERREKALRFVHEEPRKQRLAAGYLLERYLKESGVEPPYHYGKSDGGKPYLLKHPDIEFCISHSGPHVFVAVAEQMVGLDVECLDRVPPKKKCLAIAERFFTEEDKDFIEDGDREAFLKVWTFKEAVAKGLDIPLVEVMKNTDVTMLSEHIARLEKDGVMVTLCSLSERMCGDFKVKKFFIDRETQCVRMNLV